MPADRREVDRVLRHRRKLRYQLEPGRDHDVYTLTLSGYQFGWTKISRGTQYRVLDDTLLAKIAKQVDLQLSEFKDALDCTLNWPEYARILRQKNPAEQDKIPLD